MSEKLPDFTDVDNDMHPNSEDELQEGIKQYKSTEQLENMEAEKYVKFAQENQDPKLLIRYEKSRLFPTNNKDLEEAKKIAEISKKSTRKDWMELIKKQKEFAIKHNDKVLLTRIEEIEKQEGKKYMSQEIETAHENLKEIVNNSKFDDERMIFTDNQEDIEKKINELVDLYINYMNINPNKYKCVRGNNIYKDDERIYSFDFIEKFTSFNGYNELEIQFNVDTEKKKYVNFPGGVTPHDISNKLFLFQVRDKLSNSKFKYGCNLEMIRILSEKLKSLIKDTDVRTLMNQAEINIH